MDVLHACCAGLDVHKESVAIGVAEEGRAEPADLATVPNDTVQLIKRLRRLGPVESLRCCYEAGPTGYRLARACAEAEINCVVAAPSRIRPAADRVKTDGVTPSGWRACCGWAR